MNKMVRKLPRGFFADDEEGVDDVDVYRNPKNA